MERKSQQRTRAIWLSIMFIVVLAFEADNAATASCIHDKLKLHVAPSPQNYGAQQHPEDSTNPARSFTSMSQEEATSDVRSTDQTIQEEVNPELEQPQNVAVKEEL